MNKIFSDRTIALWLASMVASGFGVFQAWELSTTLDLKERVVRIETVMTTQIFKGMR